MNFLNRISAPNVSLFFVGLMLILPYQLTQGSYPIGTFYTEWLTAALALLAFIPLIRQSAWPSFQAPTILWLPIAMLAVMALQLAVLDIAYWQHYFLVAQYFIFAALLMLLGAMLKQAIGFDKTIYIIAIALVVSGLLTSVVIALQLFNAPLGAWFTSNPGKLMQANQYGQAILLSLALASLAYLYIKQYHKRSLAWILMAVLLLLPSLLYQAHTNQALHTSPATTAHQAHHQSTIESAPSNTALHLQRLKASWYVYSNQPWLGAGFGQMAGQDLSQAYRVPKLTGTISLANNTVVQLLAETGLVGTTLVLVCIIALLARTKSAPMTPERWLWWIFLIIIGAHGLIDSHWWHLQYLALVALLFGVGDVRSANISRYRPQLSLTLLAVLWLACLIQIMHDYRTVQRWSIQAQAVKQDEQAFSDMVKQLQVVRAFSPLASYGDLLLLSALPVNAESIDEKLYANTRLLNSHYTPEIAYTQATLLTLNGQLEEAKAHLNNVYLRFPGYIDSYWKSIVSLTLNGEMALYPLVQHTELLRDGTDATKDQPNDGDSQFNQPAIPPAPEVVPG